MRKILFCTFLFAVLLLNFQPLHAAYPEKPISVVVNFPAGTDVGICAQRLVNIINQGKYLSQPLQVVYKTGGVGTIGLAEVLQGRPDGYTLAWTPSAPVLIHPLIKDLPYNLESMVPIIQILKFPFFIIANADSPSKKIEDFLRDAKNRPGKVTIASAGEFTWPHIAILQLEEATKIKFRHVPLEGSSQAVTSLLGRHVDSTITSMGSAGPQVTSGKLRVLACVERERAVWPDDVPAINELGYNVPGTDNQHLLVLPKGASEEVIGTIHAAFKRAMDTSAFKDFLKQNGGTLYYVGNKDLPKYLEEAQKRIRTLFESINIKTKR
jgi:tripartite-type tricarboxylate transporter receptor subunit TctC